MTTAAPTLTLSAAPAGLTVGGDWVLASVTEAHRAVDAVLPQVVGAGRLDLGSVGRVDGSGAVVLLRLVDALETHGGCTLAGDGPAARLVALYRQRRQEPLRPADEAGLLESVGQGAAGAVDGLAATVSLFGATAHHAVAALTRPRTCAWNELPRLMLRTGGDGLGIVVMTNLLIGGIMGFQGVVQLAAFGASGFVPQMVLLAHVREMGPVMTAIIVAGRSGAGFAAELGTMQVSEEVDALRTLGLDPVRWLVVPRLSALLISLPLLTLIGMAVGLGGGMVAALPFLPDISLESYLSLTAQSLTINHVVFGLLKPVAFAIAIAVLACGQGLAARGGAAAVGARTTTAVVLAIFAVIVIDCAFAMWSTLGM